jgi:hypothetical protein
MAAPVPAALRGAFKQTVFCGGEAMAKIYREIAIDGMMGTVENAMRRVLNNWAELPPPMQDAIDQFRAQLEATIDSVYVVKRALDTQVHESEEDGNQ